ncbi:MAG: hypothetical protein AB1801_13760 [Chloroflexota bacterium]
MLSGSGSVFFAPFTTAKMNQTEKYRSKRDLYWPDVEAFFGRLPDPLRRQAMSLKNNLATFYAGTGQFSDILGREHDLPLLYLHFWLLDDWQMPATPERAALEKHLFLAMVFNFAAVYTQENILDEESNFDHRHFPLAQALARQAIFQLAQLFAGNSPFWEQHHGFWAEYEAAAAAGDRRLPAAATVAARLAYVKIPLAAVAQFADRGDALAQLCELMDGLIFVHQILADLAALRRDLSRRRLTYPLHRAMLAAGLDPAQAVAPEQLLGALVLSGAVEQLGRECLARLDECRSPAQALRLPTLAAYTGTVAAQVRQAMALFDLKAGPAPPPQPFFLPAVDTLPAVISMAEGYLLSDLTFRESWEVQRRGVFGQAELTAKAFPSGLIVEVLCRHGHDLAEAVNRIFQTLAETGCRYYDAAQIPPDTDDLGLLLRLYPFSRQPQEHQQILRQPLRRLRRNVRESGEIPVWLTGDENAAEATYQRLSLWGQSCATVEANVLLGLIAYDFGGYRSLIEHSARNVLGRLAAQSLNANRHYVPLYALWIGFELVAKIAGSPLGTILAGQLEQAAQRLAHHLAAETRRSSCSPQEAALLTLACLSTGAPGPAKELFNPRWITILCKTQRYDGSWAAEPLFGTPTRGEFAAWYSSRSVTTAYGYHALKSYRAGNYSAAVSPGVKTPG